jgi:hypothetical protein
MARYCLIACQGPNFYRDEIFKLRPDWDECISVVGDMVKHGDTSVELARYIEMCND